jgi:hypothetical protein
MIIIKFIFKFDILNYIYFLKLWNFVTHETMKDMEPAMDFTGIDQNRSYWLIHPN